MNPANNHLFLLEILAIIYDLNVKHSLIAIYIKFIENMSPFTIPSNPMLMRRFKLAFALLLLLFAFFPLKTWAYSLFPKINHCQAI